MTPPTRTSQTATGKKSSDFPNTVPANLDALDDLPASTRRFPMVETPEQLVNALGLQAKMKPIPLGEAFVGLDLLSMSQVNEALRQQKNNKSVPLGQILIDSGMLSQADLQSALVRKMGYPLVNLKKFPLDYAVIRRIPLELAMKLKALPLLKLPKALVVAMPDPLDFKGNQELEFSAGLKIIPVVATQDALIATLIKAHRDLRTLEMRAATEKTPAINAMAPTLDMKDAFQLANELTIESNEQAQEDYSIEQSDSTLVNLVNSMIK
ncbi:MAG: hypothetical protein RLZZ371_722, partial [Pseudomonadota bacterium]